MEAPPGKLVMKPTIKVQQATSGSAKEAANRLPGQASQRKSDHLGVFRSASPALNPTDNNGSSLFLTLPSASSCRSRGGRSLSAASLFNENGANPLTDEKLLIK